MKYIAVLASPSQSYVAEGKWDAPDQADLLDIICLTSGTTYFESTLVTLC